MINFTNFIKLNKIKNNIKSGINISSKSSIIINIKDIIGKLNKPYDKLTFINYFKLRINTIPEIRDLKNQKYLNICMFYIDNFENYPDKYLAYIYYNYKDLYFIYDYNEDDTKIYDIGNLEPFEIQTLFNENIKKLNGIIKGIP